MKNRRIQALSFLILILIVFFEMVLPISAKNGNELNLDFSDEAKSVYLYSYSADRVLFSQGEDVLLSPGATAKMMTGLIACEMFKEDLDKEIEITDSMISNVEGNSMNLKSGTSLKIRDLLYGTICGGNNDSAKALAILCAGNEENFIKEMNSYASALFMKNTLYANPSGYDDARAYTTLGDIAILAHNAINNDLYVEISSISSYTIDSLGQTIFNRNALVSQFSAQGYVNKSTKGLIAGKDDQGFHVVSLAEKDGEKYLCIVMGANSDEEEIYSYYIANSLFDIALKKYSLKRIAKKGDKIGEISINYSISDSDKTKVPCILPDDIYALLPYDIDINSDLEYNVYYHDKNIDAPVEKNTVVGGVDIYYKNALVASSKIVVYDNISENRILLFLTNIKSFLLGRSFLIFSLTFVLLLIIFLIINKKTLRRKKVYTVQYKKFY